MTALVIGASGQVGGALYRRLAERGDAVTGTHHTVATPGTVALSVIDHDGTARLIRETAASVVYFPAAYADVDGCEHDPARAFAVNRDAAAAAATVAGRAGAAFVYYSTEYVFDGTAGPYGEDDAVRPVSVYGRSKLEGERAVLAANADAIVIRTTVVYGVAMQEKNFVYQVRRNARAGRVMKVPADQRSSPTYADDLAAATIALADKGLRGVFHVAGPEVMDRYAFAREICRVFALDERLLTPVATAALAQAAARPLDAGLRVDRVRAAVGVRLRGPAEGLAAMRDALDGQRG